MQKLIKHMTRILAHVSTCGVESWSMNYATSLIQNESGRGQFDPAVEGYGGG
jgi:hypothetical protein